jgi:peptide/nickel transport system substrate-binding protein
VPSYQVAVMAQAMMQAVGINAQIEVLEWATQLDRYNTGNYQMSSFSYSSRLDPALSYEQFSGDKDKQPRKVWEDPEALKLIDASFSELDDAKRRAIFDQLHTMLLEQVPVILLSNGNQPWGVSKRLQGFGVWEGKPQAWGTKVSDK